MRFICVFVCMTQRMRMLMGMTNKEDCHNEADIKEISEISVEKR